jgi:hypothetical protein
MRGQRTAAPIYRGQGIEEPATSTKRVPTKRGQTTPGSGTGSTVVSGVQSVVNRTALAAANALFSAYLTEAGREGLFTWNGSDLSAMVAADAQQGIYVPPTGQNGSGGAWVRQFDGPVYPEWFGAKGNDSTPDGPAFTAMETYRIAARKAGTEYGYSYGSVGVRLKPSRAYYLASTPWEIYTTVYLETPNGSGPSGLSSIIRVDPGTSGVIFHSSVSTGVNGFTTDRGYSSVGSVARGLAVTSNFSGTESEHHGIQFRTKVVLENCWVDGFPGDGIYASSFSWDGIHDDNVNGSSISECFVRGNRNGFALDYNDANGIQIYNPQMFSNRLNGGIVSNGEYIAIYGGNSASNGCVPGFPTQVYNNGHVFGCLPGRETQCSTNSPPSTAVSDVNWYFLYNSGAATASVPQWVPGTTYRSAAPFRIDGGSETGVIEEHQPESDQMPYLMTGGCKVKIGGGVPLSIAAITETGAPYLGTIAGDSAGIYTGCVVPNLPTGSSATVGLPGYRYEHGYFQNVDVSIRYYVNGAAVLGSPRTGWTADTGTAKRTANATYAAGTTLTFSATYTQSELTALATRLAAVETALQNATQTQKAMKDDNLAHGFYAA